MNTPTGSPVRWAANGQAHSTQFADAYRSHSRRGYDLGLAQAQQVFLQGCGLWSPQPQDQPQVALAWQGQRQWHVLETGFGLGLNFLATWHAWRQDAQRPQHLFFTSVEAWPVLASDIVRSAQAWPHLQPLAEQLAQAWHGLLPGVHRLDFEGGQLHLTLCVGDVQPMLRQLDVLADSVFLDGFSPAVNPQMWSLHTLKALARLCHTGTRLASWCVKGSLRQDLAQCGFEVSRAQGLPPKSQRLQAVFEPTWTPRSRLRQALHATPRLATANPPSPTPTPTPALPHSPAPLPPPRSALVLGAGLSGAALACSLARRGWQVTVLDAGAGVGAGASGLPLGLTVPHVSPDDSVLSRISRAGVRATLQRCAELLAPDGQDWAAFGVLEHRVEGKRALPAGPAWPAAGHEWSTPASAEQIAQVGLPAQAQALWHPRAAWLRPGRLVAAQLATPGVSVRWGVSVAHLQPLGFAQPPSADPTNSTHSCTPTSPPGWQALDAQGQVLAQAEVVVVACGYHSLGLLPAGCLPLNPLRGQISMGALADLPPALQAQLPPCPVNGHGSFMSGPPLPEAFGGQPGWFLGSTFERACPQALLREQDHAANHARLSSLLPALSEPIQTAFAPDKVLGWAGLRATLPDRLPAIGPLQPQALPGLLVSVGMGARGLSLSVLCGELIAALLHAEPLPLAPALAKHLWAERFSAGGWRLEAGGLRLEA